MQRNNNKFLSLAQKVEYMSLDVATSEITWVTFILHVLYICLPQPPLLFCNILSALYMCANAIFHDTYEEIRLVIGQINTQFVSFTHEHGDSFTEL